jgi:mannosyltransferase OCH1-like enzyme
MNWRKKEKNKENKNKENQHEDVILPTISKNIKYLHQIWYDFGKGKTPPSKYQQYSEDWKRFHPNRKYILWNEQMGDALLKEHYPRYYNLYKNVQYPVMKVDLLRYCLMAIYGGIYADMDYQCLRNIDEYLDQTTETVFFNEASISLIRPISSPINICNSLIISKISEENTLFWNALLESIEKQIKSHPHNRIYGYNIYYVVTTTGPIFLSRFREKYLKDQPEFEKNIGSLPRDQFNYCNDCRCFPSYDQPLYARHDYACMWGQGKLIPMRKSISCVTAFELFVIILIIFLLIYLIYLFIIK